MLSFSRWSSLSLSLFMFTIQTSYMLYLLLFLRSHLIGFIFLSLIFQFTEAMWYWWRVQITSSLETGVILSHFWFDITYIWQHDHFSIVSCNMCGFVAFNSTFSTSTSPWLLLFSRCTFSYQYKTILAQMNAHYSFQAEPRFLWNSYLLEPLIENKVRDFLPFTWFSVKRS